MGKAKRFIVWSLVVVGVMIGAPVVVSSSVNSASSPIAQVVADQAGLQKAEARGYWKMKCGIRYNGKDRFGISLWEPYCKRVWINTTGGGGGW